MVDFAPSSIVECLQLSSIIEAHQVSVLLLVSFGEVNADLSLKFGVWSTCNTSSSKSWVEEVLSVCLVCDSSIKNKSDNGTLRVLLSIGDVFGYSADILTVSVHSLEKFASIWTIVAWCTFRTLIVDMILACLSQSLSKLQGFDWLLLLEEINCILPISHIVWVRWSLENRN